MANICMTVDKYQVSPASTLPNALSPTNDGDASQELVACHPTQQAPGICTGIWLMLFYDQVHMHLSLLLCRCWQQVPQRLGAGFDGGNLRHAAHAQHMSSRPSMTP